MVVKVFFILIIGIALVVQAKYLTESEINKYNDNRIVQLFREYIRIDTSNQDNIYQAVEFWRRQAEALGVELRVIEPAGTPICIITVEGSDPTLPSIMLNSHMDVVPAVAKDWSYPPFDAYMDEAGDIYGRGTQDTKDVSIEYIEALKTLKRNNVSLLRTFHVTLMPDEETGGLNGMKAFLNTTEFKDLNVGFALDEGLVSPDGTLYATYVDKRPWQMSFTFRGSGGHGSSIPQNTAMEKALRLIESVSKMREIQKTVLHSHNTTDFGSYTTVNINILSAGTVVNVIPNEVNVRVDMRLATAADPDDMQNMVNSWIAEAGENTTLEFIRRIVESAETDIGDTNPYWVALVEATNEMNITMVPVVCPATSDMLTLRNTRIPAIGLAPKFYTTNRIHGVNEYLNARTLLYGVEVYTKLLTKLGNMVS